jgi:hypothetical protein
MILSIERRPPARAEHFARRLIHSSGVLAATPGSPKEGRTRIRSVTRLSYTVPVGGHHPPAVSIALAAVLGDLVTRIRLLRTPRLRGARRTVVSSCQFSLQAAESFASAVNIDLHLVRSASSL